MSRHFSDDDKVSGVKISHTGHWHAPAGHWQEAPQLQPWSEPGGGQRLSMTEGGGGTRSAGNPAMTPPCPGLGAKAKIGECGRCGMWYNEGVI